MKVFVVSGIYLEGSSDVLGVFSTREAAEAHTEKVSRLTRDYEDFQVEAFIVQESVG